MKSANFLIVDGSSLLVRAYFATTYPGRPIRTAGGVPTNAVLGFLNMLTGLLQQVRPTHLFVAWDVSRDTFRRELYPAYKGTRGELPDEMLSQFDTMQEVLQAIGIAQSQDPRYEADDIIGTLAMRAAQAGHSVLIATGDRDALQLVRDNVTVAILRKGITEMDFFTPASLAEQWGLRPDQICDLKGLMGDTSDNIPGVPGIGEKTAKKLLAEFDCLEQALENAGMVKGRVGQLLSQYRDQAVLSKHLATIVLDAPMNHEPHDCCLRVNVEQAAPLFSRLELKRLLDSFEKMDWVG